MAEETDEEKGRKRHLKNQVTDFGANIPLLMSSDTREDSQPDNTFRAALNAVIEDRNQLGTIQNEESNDVCVTLPDINVDDTSQDIIGRVICSKCCEDEKCMSFYYTSENVSDYVNQMDASCDGYDTQNDSWTIEGVSGTFTKQNLISWLVLNPGTHRISPADCESTEITIEMKGCCNSTVIVTTKPYILTESFAADFISCYDFVLPSLGNKLMVGLKDSEGNIDNYEYYSSFPVSITGDAYVEIFCQNINYNSIISEVDVTSATISGITFMSLSNVGEVGGIKIYNSMYIYEIGDRCNIAFSGIDNDMFEIVTIKLNGNKLLRRNSYSSQNFGFWYFDKYIEKAIVNFEVYGNDVYSFEFSVDGHDCVKTINVEIRSVVQVYDQNGQNVGHIEPAIMICNRLDNYFYIGSTQQNSMIGCVTSSGEILSCYLVCNNGDRINVTSDNYPVDYRYNNIITVVTDENN